MKFTSPENGWNLSSGEFLSWISEHFWNAIGKKSSTRTMCDVSVLEIMTMCALRWYLITQCLYIAHFNGCYKDNTVCAYIVLQRSIQTPDSLCLQNQMNNERGINRIFVSFSRDNSKFHLSALARTHRLIILLTNRFGKTSTCKYSLYMCRT